jgi:type IV pilus assembly protein PilE
MRQQGFTLTEMLIAVGILGILAVMAVPNYVKTVERAHFRGALDVLRVIYAGEQVYFTLYDVYRAQPTTLAQWRDDLYMDDPNVGAGGVVTYTITAAASTFAATATRNGGACCGGSDVTINQDQVWGGSWNTGVGLPLP